MDNINKTEAAVEAVLFAVGESVEVERLAQAVETDKDTLTKIIRNMSDKYEKEDRGIRIIELNGAFQLCTKNEYYDVLSRVINMPKKHVLTDVLLETLSIIAYKQPVTRQEVESIRGVSCTHAINRLIEYNLVTEVGRLDAVGKPILFGTTEDFLRSFGVSSTDELPVISPDKIEDFRQEAMEELNVEIDT